MRTALLIPAAALLLLAGGSTAALAQQKTAKECEAEWRAGKVQFLAQGISEKNYVLQCRAGTAPTPAAAPSAAAAPSPAPAAPPKTARECEAEWRAGKVQFLAQGLSEKNYVVQCRAGTAPSAAAAPSPGPVAQQKTAAACESEWRANRLRNLAQGISEKSYVTKCLSASAAPSAPPAGPAPAATSSPPPAPAPSASPSPAPPPPAAARPGVPAGANQYASEVQAKARCPAGVVVWANLSTKVYHFSGDHDYGNTKRGAYMCEPDAQAEGFRAAKNEKRPS